ncbi:glycosyltransferase family 39 protein [Phycisphaeraceae bacterium D3-23]
MAEVEQHPKRYWIVCVLALAVLPLWMSLGDHPLNGRTEARYAVIAQAMARGESSWLVPEFRGEAHLTKPPLAYWASAVSIAALGENEWAVRAPSALAGSALVVGVFFFGRRLGGTRRGLLAAALLGVQPLFVAVMRQPLTDPWLTLGWVGVLACGYAVGVGWVGRGWVFGFWAGVALGLFAKAHLVLLPVGVVVLWLALLGRWDAMRRLRIWTGLPIAALPLLAWVVLVIEKHPGAVELWRHETLDRAAGSAAGGDHAEAWWYFLPVYLVGLYPANMLVDLPRVGRAVWSARGGPVSMLRKLCQSPNALWWLALGVPLLVFSLNAGKRMNYLLPLTPMIALLAAESLDYWLAQRRNDITSTTQAGLGLFAWLRGPAGLTTLLFVACVAIGPSVFLHAYEYAGPAQLTPLFAVVLGVGVFAWCWRTPHRRGAGLTIAFITFVVGWGWGSVLEDRIVTPRSARTLLTDLAQQHGSPDHPPTVYTVGFEETALVFYGSPGAKRIEPGAPGFAWDTAFADAPNPVLVWMTASTWDDIRADPRLGQAATAHLVPLTHWPESASAYGPEPNAFVLLRPRDPRPKTPTR